LGRTLGLPSVNISSTLIEHRAVFPVMADTKMNSPREVIIHAVHGTWPYGLWAALLRRRPKQIKDPLWFMGQSSFQKEVANLLSRSVQWVSFEWDGKNSFASREEAAKKLHGHLREWSEREPEAEQIIIAHSHGGSVAVETGRMLDAEPRSAIRLTKVIALASPFAQRRVSDRDDDQLAAKYLALKFGWLPIVLFFGMLWAAKITVGDPIPYLTLPLVFLFYAVVFSAVAILAAICFRIGLLRFRPPSLPLWSSRASRQSWSLYAIRAPQDEASIAITASQFINIVSDILFRRLFLSPSIWIRRKLTKSTWKGRIFLWLYIGLGFSLLKVAFEILTAALTNPHRLISELSNEPFYFALITATELTIGTIVNIIPAALIIFQLFAVMFSFVALVGPIILIPAYIILATALGLDLWRSSGLADIECEPVPSGITGVVSMIRVTEDDRQRLGMVHFLHATHAARERVAAIINDGK
jgi:hypothetical protein